MKRKRGGVGVNEKRGGEISGYEGVKTGDRRREMVKGGGERRK